MHYGLCLDTIRAIAESRDLDTLLRRFVQRVKWVLDFERCTVALLEADGGSYRQRCLMETRPDMPALTDACQGLDRGIAGRSIQERRIHVIHPDVQSGDDLPAPGDEAMEGGSLAAVLCMPLQVQSRPLGALTFGSSRPDAFEQDEIAAASLLSMHLSLAMDRLRVMNALRTANHELEQEIIRRERIEIELRHQGELLARSNADLEQFARNTSHELKEPLRSVAGYIELLARRYRSQIDERADRYIQAAVTGVNRMQQLIDGLLTYSRVVMQEDPLDRVDTNVLLDETLSDLATAIRECDGVVTRSALPTIGANRRLLGLLFQNLVSNALKYRGDAQPRVHVAAERAPDAWLFSVRDNGVGIEPDYQQRIFDVFARAHHRVDYPGNGIGLAIGKKVVERHGGRIWVESEVGQGTTFFFTIPDDPGGLGGEADELSRPRLP